MGHDQVGLLQQEQEPRIRLMAPRMKVLDADGSTGADAHISGRFCRVVRTGDDLRVDLSIPLKTSVFGGQVRGRQQALDSVGSEFEGARYRVPRLG